jgi:uncharacterized membrane protein YeiH
MDGAEAQITEVFRWVDLTGVLANAVLGGVIARSARLDPIGFAILAILSGLGGGMIRDTLLQHGPPIALTDYAYIITALVGASLAFLMKVEGPVWNRVWPVVDAVALGAWAAAGAQKTLAVGLGWLPALLLGTITAVGGGFTRDVVLRRVPGILGGNTLYATCAVIASGVMIGFWHASLVTVGALVATLVGAGLCLLARWQNWMLPVGDDEWSPARFVLDRYGSSDRWRGRVRSQRRRRRP